MAGKESRLKVVQIINDRELAVSGGGSAGIAQGDFLRVFAAEPERILDPDTGDVLGEFSRTKIVVEVFQVDERFALAHTFRTETYNEGGSGVTALGSLFMPPKIVTRVETLRRDDSDGQPISEDDAVVEIGDLVEVIDADEVDDLPTSSVWR